MSDAELKAKLERVLGRITAAEWQNLRRRDIVGEYERNPPQLTQKENWREFRDSARRELALSRKYREDDIREQTGELETDAEGRVEVDVLAPDVPITLGDRTFARLSALSALDRLRAGDIQTLRARISSTHKPRGGVDGTIPQWVIFMGVEAWIPAEELADSYRRHQQALLAEPKPSRTHARAFQVAEFVWEQERFYGTRPPWQFLWERWNTYPLTTPFENWKSFRMAFVRGADATRPRYFATEEQLTEQVISRVHEGAFDSWAAAFRELAV